MAKACLDAGIGTDIGAAHLMLQYSFGRILGGVDVHAFDLGLRSLSMCSCRYNLCP